VNITRQEVYRLNVHLADALLCSLVDNVILEVNVASNERVTGE
jgi:hypothetical protein